MDGVRCAGYCLDLELGSWEACLVLVGLCHNLRSTPRFEPDLACVAVVGLQVAVMCVVHSILWCRVGKWQSEGGSRCVGWCICHCLTDHRRSLPTPDLLKVRRNQYYHICLCNRNTSLGDMADAAEPVRCIASALQGIKSIYYTSLRRVSTAGAISWLHG